MKKIIFIVSLLLPLASVDAAYIQEAQPSHHSSAVHRVKTFCAKTAGATCSLFISGFIVDLIDKTYPSQVSEFVADYAGDNYVVCGVICLIGAYQLYQAMFGKVDNRSVVTQLVDATGVPSLTEMVWNTIKSDPKKGSTLIARELGVNEREVRRTLRTNGWDNQASREAAASGRSKTPSRR